jgi:hypothetical protein
LAGTSVPLFVNLELLIIIGLTTTVGIAYPQRERIEGIVNQVQEYSLKASYRLNYYAKSILESRRKTTCLACNASIPMDSKVCPVCNAEIKRCMVCWLPITNKKHFTECPHCHYPAHQEHWKFWTKINHKCPVCRKDIT